MRNEEYCKKYKNRYHNLREFPRSRNAVYLIRFLMILDYPDGHRILHNRILSFLPTIDL